MPFFHLNLQITQQCPLECAHCCIESGPWRTESMALPDAVSYVRQAHAINPATVLSFTGGEPFVRFPLMRDIARAADELGMWHTTITSAVWCKSVAFARERLAELQRYGLRTVNLSYDSFHEPWVTPERMQHCITAAADLGLRIHVGGAVVSGSKGARELLGSWLDRFPQVESADWGVAPNGRGALIPAERILFQEAPHLEATCPMASELLIEPDGTAYPCCTTGGDYAFLRLGNARLTPLAELRAHAERQSWFRIIVRDGFGTLERIVQQYDPDIVFPRRFVSVCHLCQLVFGAGERSERVRAALARFDADSARATTGLWGRVQAALALPMTT